jgi:hypothetical protein
MWEGNKLNKIYEKATANPKAAVLLSLLLFLLVAGACIVGYFAWQNHTAKVATYESQIQAQTIDGVELAAKAAHVDMLQSQLKDTAGQIAKLANKPPDTIIKTVPVEVEKVVIKEVEKRGADFAIVTDPNNQNKTPDIEEIKKLPDSTPVTLNQYNVFAYKKLLRDITVYPSFTGFTPSGVSEVDYGVSKKITKDGKYLGVVAGYEFDDKKAKVGLRVTF